MDRVLELIAFNDKKYLTEVEWQCPYKNISKAFWVNNLEAMLKIDKDPENDRMVFWFDN